MKRSRVAWLFAAPATLHLAVFALGPILFAFGLAFFEWNLLRGDVRFVGLGNFERIFSDGEFVRALGNSAVYAATSVPLGVTVALGVALLVAQPVRGVLAFRTIFYLPAVCSQVAMAMVWIYVFLPKTGMINAALGMVGLPDDTDFLGTPGWAMAALVFMSVWTGLGPRMVLFLAGILNIPPSLHEAASLDGAGSWARFRRITLPMLAPTTAFVTITAAIAAMQVFTPVYMMTRGGPDGTTDVAGHHIYGAAWERFQVGEASAMSAVLFAILFLLSLRPMRALARQAEETA